MKTPLSGPRAARLALHATSALLLASLLRAGDPDWKVERAEVHVVCPLTVGGSFEARTGALTGALSVSGAHPTALAGTLHVDLRTLDTGIALRDQHLRETYLEVSKGEPFGEASLSGLTLGELDPGSTGGRTAFAGTFTVHGVSKPVSGRAEIQKDGSLVRVEASFPLLLAEYAIPEPRYLGVGVKNEIQVKVTLFLRPSGSS